MMQNYRGYSQNETIDVISNHKTTFYEHILQHIISFVEEYAHGVILRYQKFHMEQYYDIKSFPAKIGGVKDY